MKFEDEPYVENGALHIEKGVLSREIDDINARRKFVAQEEAAWIASHAEFTPLTLESNTPVVKEHKAEPLKVLGLALSGGGIRSAAFCLGVLQALDVSLRKRTKESNAPSPLLRVDYLSTVSGGGYIGTSMTAAMSVKKGKFPFESKLDEEETPSMQHVRNYSNYLFPRGPGDFLRNLSIYLRGLAVNIVLVIPWLFLAAAITVFFSPSADWLNKPVLFAGWRADAGPAYFFFTLWLGVAGFAGLLLWGLWRSLPGKRTIPELPSTVVRCIGYLLVGLLVVALIEAQPLVISELIEDAHRHGGASRPVIVTLIDRLVVLLAPIGVLVTLFWQKLLAVIEGANKSPTLSRRLLAAASVVAIYVGAAALPIVLWAIYLRLSYWVIAAAVEAGSATGWLVSLAKCWLFTFPASWIAGLFSWLVSPPAPDAAMLLNSYKYASVYGIIWFVFFAIGWLFDPNANSLHRLYRDRLSNAFLIKITDALSEPDSPIPRLGSLQANLGEDELKRAAPAAKGVISRVGQGLREMLTPSAGLKISELSQTYSPYHIINAALNLQGSKAANRRGRNADFFIFSRNAIGSEATRYVATKEFEEHGAPELTLDTAMAISGAAFNANMGSLTIRPLSPTLAFLNVRLGYWMRNPRFAEAASGLKIFFERFRNPYFLYEALGRLNESKWDIYVSDGGHLENLGIYELLKRRCKVIIAVDADADENIRMSAFITLQRYARIDLGVRIELPWQRIQAASHEIDKVYQDKGGPDGKLDCRGPHCAVGRIHYRDGVEGVLVYVKASLTGDENDYVADYKRRFEEFPHETTLDQFFSEEQFEVYRALGFHELDRMLDGTDDVAVFSPTKADGELKKFSAADPSFDLVREALGFPGSGQTPASPVGATKPGTPPG
jgi:hypothetical protein